MRKAIFSLLCFPTLAFAQEDAGFRQVVAPFFEQHCTQCHGPEKQKGKIALHTISPDFAGPDQDTWSKVLEQLTIGEMPPEDEPRPDSRLTGRVRDWIRSELARAGLVVEDKLHHPAYGNYVAHKDLFGVEPTEAPRSPSRFWRIRPAAYLQMIGEISKGDGYNDPFSLTGDEGIRDYAGLYQLSTPDLELLINNAKIAARRLTAFKIEGDQIKRDGWNAPNQFLAVLDPQTDPTDEQLLNAIDWQFHRVLLRDPTEEEQERFLYFTKQSMERSGRVLGLRNLIAAVLLMPEALYRFERGEGTPDSDGRVRLSPREVAFSLAYALTDRRPDGALLKAAEEGKLATAGQVREQVDRLLTEPKIAKPRILDFFHEYFGYDAAPEVFKDADLFPQHNAKVLVQDTDFLVLHLYERDRDVLRELLTTNLSFVNYAIDSQKKTPRRAEGKKRIHEAYNLPPDWKWTPNQPVQLPGSQRAGILTQPSWLVAHSDNFDNHVIRRGKWIRERLLGGTIPDLPITVDAQLPDDKTLTLRQRMKVTHEEECWRCHQRMNPLGFPFELYDHFGRWRTKELARTVETSGRIDRSGVAGLERDVDDPFALIETLAESNHVRQVFVRHAFRFWLGRNERPGDAATLQEADRAYIDSGGSMKALIASLLTSDSFLYRDADPPANSR